ncbi:MAG: hypothetical protein JSR58_07295 [Verrucomicrobia bacterium]|nr:hypothetical protein [Verrucomicrobiota bacterium]
MSGYALSVTKKRLSQKSAVFKTDLFVDKYGSKRQNFFSINKGVIMSEMTWFRAGITTLAGYGAGHGVAMGWHALKPVFLLDPRAAGIAAATGALFMTFRHNAELNRVHIPIDRDQWRKNCWSFGFTTAATFVAYHILKHSKFNSTIGQTLTGVFIGIGAKLIVDYFFLTKISTSEQR